MLKVGDRIVGKAAGPSFFLQIAGKHGLIVKVDVHNLIGLISYGLMTLRWGQVPCGNLI